MDAIAFILLAALSGLIVGALGRLVVPGPDPMSILETILLGVAGSLVAGLISFYLFDHEGAPGILLSVACAALLVFAIRKLRDRDDPRPATSDRGSPLGTTPGYRTTTQVHFMPGCLITSLLLSLFLTIALNLLIRLF